MNKKVRVLWCYLWLLSLAACGPRIIDDADRVSLSYSLSYNNTEVKSWEIEKTIWDKSEFEWMDDILRWLKNGDIKDGTINWFDAFPWEYNENLKQEFPNIIITEVLWLSDPKENDEVSTSSLWTWVIVDKIKDEKGYDVFVVDFNNPMYYDENIVYHIEINNVEKD